MTKNADLADLRLEADSFRYKSAHYPFSEIAHLRFARMNLTTYMVPVKLGTEGSAALIVELMSGEQLKFVEKPGWFLTSEQQKIDGIVDLYVHLSQATFQARLAEYLSAADQRGYFVLEEVAEGDNLKVVLGGTIGNNINLAAELITNAATIRAAHPADLEAGLKTFLGDVQTMAGHFTTFLEGVTLFYLREMLGDHLAKQGHDLEVKVSQPFSEVRIPYFCAPDEAAGA